jgi:tRNA(fMet)-specific endonuclease VapC
VFLLDTNVAIHLRDGDDEMSDRVAALGDATFSVLTRIELEGGIAADPARAGVRRMRVDRLLAVVSVLAFDDAAADRYREILTITGFSRRRILDRMIAAQALVHDATLVTLNGTDFKDIPGLKVLAW